MSPPGEYLPRVLPLRSYLSEGVARQVSLIMHVAPSVKGVLRESTQMSTISNIHESIHKNTYERGVWPGGIFRGSCLRKSGAPFRIKCPRLLPTDRIAEENPEANPISYNAVATGMFCCHRFGDLQRPTSHSMQCLLHKTMPVIWQRGLGFILRQNAVRAFDFASQNAKTTVPVHATPTPVQNSTLCRVHPV